MPARPPARAVTGSAAWLAAVAAALVWGHRLVRERPQMRVTAAPFVGTWLPIHTRRTLVPIAVAVAVVAVARWATTRLGWRVLLAATALVAVGWLVALNHVDAVPGTDALRTPLTTRYDYLAGLPDVRAAGGGLDYLRSFTDRIDRYPTHVRGHPPGMVMVLWGADRVGLDPVDAALVLAIGGWAVAVAGSLVALREVAGEAAARRVAPFAALLPGAIWAGTSLDAFFAGVTVAGTALVVLATGGRGRRSDGLAVAGGLVLGGALLLSYGTVPALLVPVAVAVSRRRWRPLLLAGAAASAVLLAMAGAGFSWLDGLHATRLQYRAGLAAVRPFSYWVLGNLAAVGVAAGPVVGAGLALVGRSWRPAILGLAATAAIVVADLSGLSKGEVERIWLPFVPWLVGLAALLPARGGGPDRRWLTAQATLAIVVQVWLRTPW